MPETSYQFKELLDKARSGSPEAACDLLNLYGHHVIRVVRRMITREMRAVFDSTDFAQMVWASFFDIAPELHAIDTPEQLIDFVCRMARNKLVTHYRRAHVYRKTAVSRQVELDELNSEFARASARKRDTPSGFAIAKDLWLQLLTELPPNRRAILSLRLQGHTYDEIASELGISSRTVKRAMSSLQRAVNENNRQN